MSTFNFDSFQEFGLFFKINSQEYLNLSPDPNFHEKINEYIRIFDHSKGGCGCSIAKRRVAASEKYVDFVPNFFSGFDDEALGQSLVLTTKNLLNSPDTVGFKKETDDQGFFFSI